MFPTGWAGACHLNDRFLFRDLSAWWLCQPLPSKLSVWHEEEWRQKSQLSDDQTLFGPGVGSLWNHGCSSRPLHRKRSVKVNILEGAAVGWLYRSIFQNKSLGPVQSPESKKFIRGRKKKVDVLFHTPNKFCLEQRRVKRKHKRTRNNGLAFYCFLLTIGIRSVSEQPQ